MISSSSDKKIFDSKCSFAYWYNVHNALSKQFQSLNPIENQRDLYNILLHASRGRIFNVHRNSGNVINLQLRVYQL